MDRTAPINTHPLLLDITLMRERVPSFDAYPYNLPAVRSLGTLALHPDVTFLVGENGAGKSTLIEALAVAIGLNAEGGSKNFRFSTRASHSDLHEHLFVQRGKRRARDFYFLRAESFFNLATEIERLDQTESKATPILKSYGGRALHEQSHGESFFALFENRLSADGIYLMDEPEAALSPTRQMSFLAAIHRLVKAGSQLVIATHSPIIMAYPHAWIYLLGDAAAGPRRVAYEETEHHKVTKLFLARTEKMLDVLLADERPEADAPPRSP